MRAIFPRALHETICENPRGLAQLRFPAADARFHLAAHVAHMEPSARVAAPEYNAAAAPPARLYRTHPAQRTPDMHEVRAASGVPRSMWYGSLAEARPTATTGPVKVVGAPKALLQVALVASSVWNRFVPAMQPRLFNISEKLHNGDVVGTVSWPCHPPPVVCNVTVDPRYEAPLNVLVHEFGHGLGLPAGASSGIGSIVDSTNHWAPQTVDPTEIMTANIDPEPYLALYTLRAMDAANHRGCVGDYQCRSGYRCYPTSLFNGPGVCERPSPTIISSSHASDDMGWAFAVGVVGACAIAGLAIAILV